MKRIFLLTSLLVAVTSFTVAQQYLESTTSLVAAPTETGWSCDPNFQRSMTFDLERINSDPNRDLDVAIGISVQGFPQVNHIFYLLLQDFNNGSGNFPAQNGNFAFSSVFCADNDRIAHMVFGQLRNYWPVKDLAVMRQSGTYIFKNNENGMDTNPQLLSGSATDGSWGVFNQQDGFPDLAVTNGSGQVRIYNSNNDGTVSSSPTTFSVTASQIVLAQMNASVFEPPSSLNRWELVSITGNTLSIRLNNNSNGFNSPQDINVGDNITSFAIGDVNNDNFNDIAVATSNSSVRLYLNSGGTINSSPSWTVSNAGRRVVIGDLGKPGDANRNDGWNDIVTAPITATHSSSSIKEAAVSYRRPSNLSSS